jgi:hypothetical protein
VVITILAASGCSTTSMLAWQGVDQTLGPFGTVNHRHRPGPPVEEQRDVVLLPIEPAPARAPEPAPPPSEVIVVPSEPEPVEPPASDQPVGPSLASLPLHLRCDARQRAEADQRAPYVQPFSYWLYVPTFFASASLFVPVVFGAVALADELEAKDSVPRSWIVAGVIAPASILLVADIIGGALIAYGQPVTWLEPELAEPRWVRGREGCAHLALEHAGQRYRVRPDGSLDAWDEAYLVASLVADAGPLIVVSDDVQAVVPIDLDTRCALARDRGYAEPRGCRPSLAPSSTGVRLPVQLWRPR